MVVKHIVWILLFVSVFALINSGIAYHEENIKTTLNNFNVLAEIDYVNGTTQSYLGGEYGTEVACVDVADLDSDGTPEYITLSKDISLGIFSWISDGGVNLRVWHRNGGNFTLIDDVSWEGNVSAGGFWGSAVKAYQMDSTPNLEIITASRNNPPGGDQTYGYLKIWRWENSKLSLLTEVNWSDPYGGEVRTEGIAVGDVDNDGNLEIIVVGNFTGHSSGSAAYIAICEYNSGNDSLRIGQIENWGESTARGVDVGDVDGDGKPEIVEVGATLKLYPDNSYTQAGEIRVWKYNGSSLTLIANISWDSTIGSEIGNHANRLITDVKIKDGKIFVVSTAEAGYKWGELTVWQLSNNALQMITGVNFLYNLDNVGMQSDTTVPMQIKFGDVDDNGRDEIVINGATGNSNFMEYFLSIFDYDLSSLAERVHEIWYDYNSGGSGINVGEGLAIERITTGKDKIVMTGVYLEQQGSNNCKHGRIWLLEYNGEPNVAEFPITFTVIILFAINLTIRRLL